MEALEAYAAASAQDRAFGDEAGTHCALARARIQGGHLDGAAEALSPVLARDFRADDLDASMAVVGDDRVTRFLSFDTKTRAEQAALLTAAVGADNAASIAVVTRGFTHEGRLRDHVHTNGAWRDSELFSILEHEWKSE